MFFLSMHYMCEMRTNTAFISCSMNDTKKRKPENTKQEQK